MEVKYDPDGSSGGLSVWDRPVLPDLRFCGRPHQENLPDDADGTAAGKAAGEHL